MKTVEETITDYFVREISCYNRETVHSQLVAMLSKDRRELLGHILKIIDDRATEIFNCIDDMSMDEEMEIAALELRRVAKMIKGIE